jgi:hypothetical protein
VPAAIAWTQQADTSTGLAPYSVRGKAEQQPAAEARQAGDAVDADRRHRRDAATDGVGHHVEDRPECAAQQAKWVSASATNAEVRKACAAVIGGAPGARARWCRHALRGNDRRRPADQQRRRISSDGGDDATTSMAVRQS